MKKMRYGLFFGDSITYGEYDGVFGGWVDILKRYALQNTMKVVMNSFFLISESEEKQRKVWLKEFHMKWRQEIRQKEISFSSVTEQMIWQ